MNEPAKLILTLLITQFVSRHCGKFPEQIVVTPLALLALALKGSVAPRWMSVPVECREIAEAEATDQSKGRRLGIFLKPEGSMARLVACDLV